MKRINFITLIFLFSLVSISFAHKLNVFAYIENGKINISSYFVDGTPCKNCTITLYKDNKEVFRGKTNSEGELLIENKWNMPIKMISEESLGHKGEFVLEGEQVNENKGSETTHDNFSKDINLSVSRKMIEDIVKAEIEKSLRPYKIYMGIATLLGFFGILMLFKKR